MCSHHLVPAVGWAAIGYLPHKRVVGLSKLTRLVQAAGTRKPSTQEEITNTIADTLHQTLECLGTIVITKAEHGCMSVRGVNAPGVYTSVSAVRGLFLTNPSAKQEFFDILKLGA
jgi:GTP cyclohydrolase I